MSIGTAITRAPSAAGEAQRESLPGRRGDSYEHSKQQEAGKTGSWHWAQSSTNSKDQSLGCVSRLDSYSSGIWVSSEEAGHG